MRRHIRYTRAASVLVTACFSLLAAVPASAIGSSDLWINEIHYDNDSADLDEFVELAGIAGLDLAKVALAFYNGANGSTYKTVALDDSDGVLVDSISGYGFYAVYVPGIQNGSPDGVALSYDGTLVQFLSYEGSFDASDDIAEGLTSADIGVLQLSSTDPGYSLQLTGLGTTYSDFTWTGPSTDSPGSANIGQSFAARPDSGPDLPGPTQTVPASGSSATLLCLAALGLGMLRRRL